jgi:hypothetical protein
MELCVILFVMILSGFYILFSAIFAAKQALQPSWEKKSGDEPVPTVLPSAQGLRLCQMARPVPTGIPSAQVHPRKRSAGAQETPRTPLCRRYYRRDSFSGELAHVGPTEPTPTAFVPTGIFLP